MRVPCIAQDQISILAYIDIQRYGPKLKSTVAAARTLLPLPLEQPPNSKTNDLTRVYLPHFLPLLGP